MKDNVKEIDFNKIEQEVDQEDLDYQKFLNEPATREDVINFLTNYFEKEMRTHIEKLENHTITMFMVIETLLKTKLGLTSQDFQDVIQQLKNSKKPSEVDKEDSQDTDLN